MTIRLASDEYGDVWNASFEVTVYGEQVRGVHVFAEAEKPGASVPQRTLLKQLMENLGVSLPGLLRLRWIIDAEPQGTDDAVRTDTPEAANRFRIIEGERRAG
jgi:hypothetical protein